MNKSNYLAFTGVLMATFVNMLMQTLVAAILPQIVQDIGGEALYGWVFSSFLLISTITIPLFAKLADQYGYKQWFLIGMVLFLVGAFVCGIASSMPLFLTGRIIQGIGVGAIGPVTIALISHLFSIEDRGRAMALYAITQIGANISAPLMGGWMAQTWGWSYAFYVAIPFGILSSLLIILFLPQIEVQQCVEHKHKFDWLGALLLGGTIALFIQGCTMWGKSYSQLMYATFLFSLMMGIIFVLQQRKHENPVIPTKLIKITNIRLANASAFLIGFLMYGLIVILPLYSSVNKGDRISILQDKLLVSLMLGFGLGAILSSWLIKKVSFKILAMIGWFLILIACGGLTFISLHNIMNLVTFGLILLAGWGIGTLIPTFLLPAQNAAPASDQAVVGGIVQLSRNSGGAVGIPILTTILTLPNPFFGGSNGYSFVFFLLGLCTVVGFCIGTQFTTTKKKQA
ncbi:MFS transporter [Shimazuella alba]|uniref:MFS transporter n=1 Tax=Shimazuella alba TaxID=2690964 RepID=A0A6I4VWF7_9BACL|nr:MFS transporter [Shimazuella alba]MXQ54938.1 MFS transporter [Shimazuella alba]